MADAAIQLPSLAPPLVAGAALPDAPELVIRETPLASLVQVAWWPGRRGATSASFEAAGLPGLPGPGRSTERAETTTLDAGPGRALMMGDASLPGRLGQALNAHDGTATDLTHSRIRFTLEGRRARAVLAKGTSVDLRPHAFDPGTVAWTTIHTMGVVVRCREADTFDVLVYRGFARAFAEWLTIAALPDGL